MISTHGAVACESLPCVQDPPSLSPPPPPPPPPHFHYAHHHSHAHHAKITPIFSSFGVQVIIERTDYAIRDGSIAREWTLEFRNTGPNATAPLCAVNTLDAFVPLTSTGNLTVSAYSGAGSFGEAPPNLFAPPAVPIGELTKLY